MESRVLQAVAAFEKGYNCCQSVFSTYADLFGIDKETALKMSSAMGAGMGRMREVCGPVSAMAMLAGLKEGNADADDQEAKEHIYALTRELADAFRRANGTMICRELLGIEGREESAAPSIRTPEYYAARPCRGLVRCAAQILEDRLFASETN